MLAEVVVSLFIFAIMATVVLNGIVFSMRSLEYLRDDSRATQVLLDKTEVVRLCTLGQVRNASYVPRTFTDGNYTGTVSVGPVPFVNSYSSNLSAVTFTVNWKSSGTPCRRSWTTYVAKTGLQGYIAR